MSKYSTSKRRFWYLISPGFSARNLRFRQLFHAALAKVVIAGSASDGLGYLLKFEEADGLLGPVFGDREIFRGQSFDGLAALVFHIYRFDHQLAAGGERGRSSPPVAGAFWPICCAASGQRGAGITL